MHWELVYLGFMSKTYAFIISTVLTWYIQVDAHNTDTAITYHNVSFKRC